MTWHGVPVPYAGRDDWLERRKAGIGGSDVAGILELSPWATPFSVWADKTDQYDGWDDENESMYWGRVLEDVVVDEFQARSGLHVHGRQWLVHHPQHPWAMCTLDGLAFESPFLVDASVDFEDFDPLGNVQVKTDAGFGKWNDGVPDQYRIQVQWEMFVTGLEHTWIPVLHGGRHYECYEVEYDDVLSQKIFARVSEFRDRFIVGDETPDVDGSDVTAGVVKGMWSESSGAEIDLAPDAAADLEALIGWKAQRKEIDEQVKRLETRIRVAMQDAEVGFVDGVKRVSYPQITSQRLDSKRLKEDRPDVWEKYAEPSSYRRLTVKKGDE